MENREQLKQLVIDKALSVSSGKYGKNVIFVKGEAGIGKTTLLNNIILKLNESPELFLACKAECSTPIMGKGDSEALLPWMNILENLAVEDKNNKHHTHQLINDLALAWIKLVPIFGSVISDTAKALKVYLKSVKKKGIEGSDVENQSQLFQQFVNLLKKLSQNVTVILIFDDFHWSDSSSNNLLFTAARQLRESKILFIVAYRPEDIKFSGNGEAHYLLNIKNELMRYDLCEDIELKGISQCELNGILNELFTRYESNADFEQWLLTVSKGNVLFITQFINTLKEEKFIDEKSGKINSDYQKIQVPQTIYSVIKNRINYLPDESKYLLRYASVEGDVFSFFILSKITEFQPLQLLQKLRSLEEKYSLIRSFGKQPIYAQESTIYEFCNSVLQKIMYDSLLEEEKEILHREIFEIIKNDWNAVFENGLNILKTAQKLINHAEFLKEYLFGSEVLLESARTSWKTFSEKETLKKIDKALTFLQLESERPGSNINKIYKLNGDLLFLKGRVNENRAQIEAAKNNYTEAAEYYKNCGDNEKYIDSLNAVAWVLGILYKHDEAILICKKALDKCNETDYLKGKAILLNTKGCLLNPITESDEIIKLFKESMEIKKSTGDIRGYAITLTNIGKNHLANSEYEKSLEYLDEALKIFEEDKDPLFESVILNNKGIALEELGFTEEALSSYEQSLILREKTGNLRGQGSAYDNIGNIMKKSGKYELALENIQKSLDMFTKAEDTAWTCFELNELGSIYRLMGNFDKASEYISKAEEYLDKINDTYTISHVYYESGAIEKAIAMKYPDDKKIEKLRHAKNLILKALEFSARNDKNEIKIWKEELKQLDEMILNRTQ